MATHGTSAFYSVNLVRSSAPVCSPVVGSFSGSKTQEIIIATANALTIYRIDRNLDRLVKLVTHEVFGIIRSMASFRVTGSSQDYVILGTESGKITVLEFHLDTKSFIKVHQETFGKSGVRRVVPGEFMAVDPKGRAVMIAAVEKNKLVYVLNRDAAANLTISSPLEALSPSSLLFHVISLDVGYDNPVFATLEVNYSDADEDPSGQAYRNVQKTLTFYELDLGLNHVVREWTELVDRNSNFLIPVPGGSDDPSGVLVCCPDSIIYKHKGRTSRRLPIPRRRGAYEDPNKVRSIVSSITHRIQGATFLLVQTNEGDLFRIMLEGNKHEITALSIKYFDTVPVASGLSIFRSGYLFVASEFGPQQLYKFEQLGNDDDEISFPSTVYEVADEEKYRPVYFHPRPLLNLSLVETIEALNPLIDARVMNLTNEEAPQIYAVSGRGARSSINTIRHGLQTTGQVVSDLPARPTAIWTTKLRSDDEFDSYFVLSFSDATLVMSIGETSEELSNTGFLAETPTLAVQQIGDDALIQVHPKGIRHIRADKKVNEWQAPPHRTIVQAATNSRQVVVALSSAELVYFELDSDGQLNEYQDKKDMNADITSLSIGAVPEGRQRNPFLAVACDHASDGVTVRIISLDPDSTLDQLSVQALSGPASSLCMTLLDDGTSLTSYLHIGLRNGTYIRTVLEQTTGLLIDSHTRFLGPCPIKLFQVMAQGQPAVLALCTRPWLAYIHSSTMQLNPLLGYQALDFAHSFSSDQVADGVVAVQGASLVIFRVDDLANRLKADSHPLEYTPRKFAKHPTSPYLYIVEADHHVMTSNTKNHAIKGKQNGDAIELDPKVFGRAWAKAGSWASCIRIFDPVTQATVDKIELEDNEAAFCVTIASFSSRDGELYLAVGTARRAQLAPKSCESGYLHLYKFLDAGRALEFVHRTELDDIPLAVLAFQGRLLVALGGAVRLYDIGKKKCLRKSETQVTQHAIVAMHTQGDRVVFADSVESVHYAAYKPQENKLICFANDTISRATSASTMVDYETVAGGDKFGNIWLVRCPPSVSALSDNDTTGNTLIHEKSYLQGSAHRLDTIAHYHLGDIPTSIEKTQLVSGGRPVLVITGIMGTISLLIPFIAKEDVEFFQQLEIQMRVEDPPLAGRDHLVYRGYYAPPKSVIDGDLCERFVLLNQDQQSRIAGELDKTVSEVKSKLENMRIHNAI